MDDKIKALATHLDILNDEDELLLLEESKFDSNIIEFRNEEYFVLNVHELYEEIDKKLKIIYERDVLPDIHETILPFIDIDKWKNKTKKDVETAMILDSMDGEEHKVKVGNEIYSIYRLK
ncbi:MAG: hypothetical protein JRL30_28250 [Deltaproteobacteria bacterium]|nr:hypothetical protein [Deltaproteobacteria bacterium]